METRKAQLTGGSTFTVSLPKEWARANDLEAGTVLSLLGREDGSLIIEPETSGDSWTATVEVGETTDSRLDRIVHALYTAGFDECPSPRGRGRPAGGTVRTGSDR